MINYFEIIFIAVIVMYCVVLYKKLEKLKIIYSTLLDEKIAEFGLLHEDYVLKKIGNGITQKITFFESSEGGKYLFYGSDWSMQKKNSTISELIRSKEVKGWVFQDFAEYEYPIFIGKRKNLVGEYCDIYF
jgi:hypothetical protein